MGACRRLRSGRYSHLVAAPTPPATQDLPPLKAPLKTIEARVVLYSRDGCHLCEEVRAQLQSLQNEHGFSLLETDIDHDTDLLEEYGDHVPVVTVNGVEALRHHWSPRRFLGSLLKPG